MQNFEKFSSHYHSKGGKIDNTGLSPQYLECVCIYVCVHINKSSCGIAKQIKRLFNPSYKWDMTLHHPFPH